MVRHKQFNFLNQPVHSRSHFLFGVCLGERGKANSPILIPRPGGGVISGWHVALILSFFLLFRKVYMQHDGFIDFYS